MKAYGPKGHHAQSTPQIARCTEHLGTTRLCTRTASLELMAQSRAVSSGHNVGAGGERAGGAIGLRFWPHKAILSRSGNPQSLIQARSGLTASGMGSEESASQSTRHGRGGTRALCAKPKISERVDVPCLPASSPSCILVASEINCSVPGLPCKPKLPTKVYWVWGSTAVPRGRLLRKRASGPGAFRRPPPLRGGGLESLCLPFKGAQEWVSACGACEKGRTRFAGGERLPVLLSSLRIVHKSRDPQGPIWLSVLSPGASRFLRLGTLCFQIPEPLRV